MNTYAMEDLLRNAFYSQIGDHYAKNFPELFEIFKEITGNKGEMLALIMKDVRAYSLASNSLRKIDEFSAEVWKISKAKSLHLSVFEENLDPYFWLGLIRLHPEAICAFTRQSPDSAFIEDAYRINPEIIHCDDALRRLDKRLNIDKEIILSTLIGHSKYDSLIDNYDFMISAIKRNAKVFAHASDRLKNSSNFTDEAFEVNPEAILHASLNFQSNYLDKLIEKTPGSREFTSKLEIISLLNNENKFSIGDEASKTLLNELTTEKIKKHLAELLDTIKIKKDLFLNLIKYSKIAFFLTDSEFRQDDDFLIDVYKVNKSVFKLEAFEKKNDFNFMQKLIKTHPEAISDIGSKLKNKEFIERAFKTNPEIILHDPYYFGIDKETILSVILTKEHIKIISRLHEYVSSHTDAVDRLLISKAIGEFGERGKFRPSLRIELPTYSKTIEALLDNNKLSKSFSKNPFYQYSILKNLKDIDWNFFIGRKKEISVIAKFYDNRQVYSQVKQNTKIITNIFQHCENLNFNIKLTPFSNKFYLKTFDVQEKPFPVELQFFKILPCEIFNNICSNLKRKDIIALKRSTKEFSRLVKAQIRDESNKIFSCLLNDIKDSVESEFKDFTEELGIADEEVKRKIKDFFKSVTSADTRENLIQKLKRIILLEEDREVSQEEKESIEESIDSLLEELDAIDRLRQYLINNPFEDMESFNACREKFLRILMDLYIRLFSIKQITGIVLFHDIAKMADIYKFSDTKWLYFPSEKSDILI